MISSAETPTGTAQTPKAPGPILMNLLVIDDDRGIRNALRDTALSFGFTTFVATSAEQGYRLLENQIIDVLLLDFRLPGASGLDALREIRARWPEIIVVMLTGHATVESAVHAMKNGAYDFVTKPFGMEELKAILERVIGLLQLKAENRVLRERMNSTHGFGNLIGSSPAMEKLYRLIAKAANSTHPVLITGEAGSGKEAIARSIHSFGPLPNKPFVPVDCASLSPSLLEAELFGSPKPDPRAAQWSNRGLLSIAEGGTVLLDEIGELPVDLQARLFRALQDKIVRGTGSARGTNVQVRVLATTSCDLQESVSRGTFRKDLFSCISVLSLRIPALRERRQDIPLLAAHFLESISRSGGAEHTLGDDALRSILTGDWPGNVRELENCVERACALSNGKVLHAWDFPSTSSAYLDLPSGGGTPSANIMSLTELERQAILSTIARTNGDKLKAARLLGIGKTTLYRKLKEYAHQDGSLGQGSAALD